MTMSGLCSPTEALQILGLYNPDTDKKAYTCHLTNLAKRGLLKRVKVGHRSIVYKKKDCEALFERAEKEGLNLKQKPAKGL
jgi:hypothetical protein